MFPEESPIVISESYLLKIKKVDSPAFANKKFNVRKSKKVKTQYNYPRVARTTRA